MKFSQLLLLTSILSFIGASAQTYSDLIHEADQFFLTSDYEQAVKGFTKAIESDSKKPLGFLYRGDAYNKLWQFEEAIRDYNKAEELGILNEKMYASSLFRGRAFCYDGLGQYQQAVSDYAKLIESAEYTSYFIKRAHCYRKLGLKEKACADFQTAAEKNDKNASIHAALLGCEWAAEYAKKLNHEMSPIQWKMAMVDLYIEGDNVLDAVRAATEAIALEPQSHKGYFARGIAYYSGKQFRKALADYSRAFALSPNNSEILTERALVHKVLKQYDSASFDFEKVTEISHARNEKVWLELAKCYAALDKKDKACEAFDIAYSRSSMLAREEAKKIGCAWALKTVIIDLELTGNPDLILKNGPCTPQPNTLQKVVIDPITGVVFLMRGLGLTEFLITRYDNPRNMFAYLDFDNTKLAINFSGVHGFCVTDKKIKLILSYQLKDSVGRVILEGPDAYSDRSEGIDDIYNNLLLRFHVTPDDKILKNYSHYALSVQVKDQINQFSWQTEIPFRKMKYPQTVPRNNVEKNYSPIESEMSVARVENAKAEMAITLNSHPIDFTKLKRNKEYKLNWKGLEGFQNVIGYQYKLVNAQGATVATSAGQLPSSPSIAFSSKGMAKGRYQLWVSIRDGENHAVGMTIPVTIL